MASVRVFGFDGLPARIRVCLGVALTLAVITATSQAQDFNGFFADFGPLSQADLLQRQDVSQALQELSNGFTTALRGSASPVELTYPFNGDVCQLLLDFSSPVAFTHTKVTINTLTGVVTVMYSLASYSAVFNNNSVSYSSNDSRQTYQLKLPTQCRYDKASLWSADAGFSIHPQGMKLRVWVPHRQPNLPALEAPQPAPEAAAQPETEPRMDIMEESQESEEPSEDPTEEEPSRIDAKPPVESPATNEEEVQDEAEVSLPERQWEF